VSDLDRARLAKLFELAGSTSFEGEALVAMRKGFALLRASIMTFHDALKPFDELQIAIDAARSLLEENEALRTELGQYRNAVTVSRNGGWYQAGDHRDQARWVLDLADRGLVRLNEFERKFLGTVSRWRGDLTEKQQPIWDDILPEIPRRSGRVPP
jgi:hypothetical protein